MTSFGSGMFGSGPYGGQGSYGGNTQMGKSAVNTFIPSAYSVWTAPFGTTAPTTPTANPGAGWYEVGYLSDAGITEGRNINETKIYDLVGALLRVARNQEERPFTFEAVEDNRVVAELRYPGSTVTSSGGTAEVQSVTISGGPTGGTFTLTGGYGGAGTTTAIPYNATAAVVQTAVQALPGFSGAVVTGSAGGPYTITFPVSLGNVNQLTASSSLTGGTNPAVAVATTTPGVAAVSTRAVGSGTGQNLRAWVIYVADGSKQKMFVINSGEATQNGTIGLTGSGVGIAQFELQPYLDSAGNFFSVIDNTGVNQASYA